MKLGFQDIFWKNAQISKLMKIRPVGAELFLRGPTDLTKLIVAFRNFATAPKIHKHYLPITEVAQTC